MMIKPSTSLRNEYNEISSYCKQNKQPVFLTKNGEKWRKVAPNAKVTSRGPIVHGAGNVYAREIELTTSPDTNGVRVYDYIQRPSA